MRASVINRIAKISASAARRADTAWVRRLAATVPLAAVVAVGAVACGPANGHGSAAQAAGAQVTAAPSAAIPGAGVSPTPTAAATTPAAPGTPAPQSTPAVPTAGTDTDTPASRTGTRHSKAPAGGGHSTAPTGPAAASPGVGTGVPAVPVLTAGFPTENDVTVRLGGWRQGLAVGAAQPTTFTLTFINTSGHRLDAVAPVLSVSHYPGARCQQTPMVRGSLQRRDASGWTDLALSQGIGTDFEYSGDNAAFALEPGASRTVDYRIALGADNGPGGLELEADAFLAGSRQSHPLVGGETINITVSDDHRPSVSMPAHTLGVGIGGPAARVDVAPANYTKDAMGSLSPRLTFKDPAGKLRPQDITVEVLLNGTWKPVPMHQDCDGVATDSSSVVNSPAPAGQSTTYEFRYVLNKSTAKDVTSFTMSAGAIGDGHYAAPVNMLQAVIH